MSAAKLEALYRQPTSSHYEQQQQENQQQRYQQHQQETQEISDDQMSIPTIDYGAIAPSNNINLVRGVSTLAGLDGFMGIDQSMEDLDSLLGDGDGNSLRGSFLQPQTAAPITMQQKQEKKFSGPYLVEMEGSSLNKDSEAIAVPSSYVVPKPITAPAPMAAPTPITTVTGPSCKSIASPSNNSVGGATVSRGTSKLVGGGKGIIISPCQSEKKKTVTKKLQKLKGKLTGSPLGNFSSPEIEMQYKRHLEKLRRKMKQSEESRALIQHLQHSLVKGRKGGNAFRVPALPITQADNPITRIVTSTESDLLEKSNPSVFDAYYDRSTRQVLQGQLSDFGENNNISNNNNVRTPLPSPLINKPLLPGHNDDGHMDLEKFRRSETRSGELNKFERRPSWIAFRSSSRVDRRKRASVLQNEPFPSTNTNGRDMSMAQAAALVAASYDDGEDAFVEGVSTGAWEFLEDD